MKDDTVSNRIPQKSKKTKNKSKLELIETKERAHTLIEQGMPPIALPPVYLK